MHVSHFPAGASKWNKVEHRLFSSLIDIETVIDLIGSTTATTGLKVMCIPSYNKYELGKKVSDIKFKSPPVQYLNDLGKRNYVIDAKEYR